MAFSGYEKQVAQFMKENPNTIMHEEAIELALQTWYPPNHSLHSCPHYPLGKLLGEWGELLDDYMKGEYKPGYKFEPENELGDIWYYLRILCYQHDYFPIKPAEYIDFNNGKSEYEIDFYISLSIGMISTCLVYYHIGNLDQFDIEIALNYSYDAIILICNKHNLTLDDLTASNWEKLKPGSKRGEEWMKAR